eukprot:EC790475.1.p1 GENE.EC790475.1~~EC790475.1.p1  ORF type:complete len:95 (-),score=20.41 EC790475.1:20-304(-)
MSSSSGSGSGSLALAGAAAAAPLAAAGAAAAAAGAAAAGAAATPPTRSPTFLPSKYFEITESQKAYTLMPAASSTAFSLSGVTATPSSASIRAA